VDSNPGKKGKNHTKGKVQWACNAVTLHQLIKLKKEKWKAPGVRQSNKRGEIGTKKTP